MLPVGDGELLRIVDAALLDAVQRSGRWLACRPGCSQCCTGVFRISQLDAERLRTGLLLLSQTEPEAAAHIRTRVAEACAALLPTFPGNGATGVLGEEDASLEAFEDFGDNQVCPVLDPATGTCGLYAHRPMTCRTFGPPTQTEDGGLGTCELCFQGATEAEVKRGELHLPAPELENSLTATLSRQGETIVAFALREVAD